MEKWGWVIFPICHLWLSSCGENKILLLVALCFWGTPSVALPLKVEKYCWRSSLCLAYMNFVSLFHFSCNSWNVRRQMVSLKVTYEQYNLKILKIDHCANNYLFIFCKGFISVLFVIIYFSSSDHSDQQNAKLLGHQILFDFVLNIVHDEFKYLGMTFLYKRIGLNTCY